jgi:hypothetical protein
MFAEHVVIGVKRLHDAFLPNNVAKRGRGYGFTAKRER